jgi:hypothetical protein
MTTAAQQFAQTKRQIMVPIQQIRCIGAHLPKVLRLFAFLSRLKRRRS